MAIQKSDWIWSDGRFLPWDESRIHMLTHTLHYGLGVFEGIRCYPQPNGQAGVFRLHSHLERLMRSCKIIQMDCPVDIGLMHEACLGLLARNQLSDAYIRPLVYQGEESLRLADVDLSTHVMMAAWPWRAFIRENGLRDGIRACISHYTRAGVNTFLAKGKISGQYVQSVLAKREALRLGFDDAILLDATGCVTEASSENLFIFSNGVLRTPPLHAAILEGITRDTILALARDQGIPIEQVPLVRDQLYTADEVFLTGTAAEVTPVCDIDGRRIGNGKPGPLTQQLQQLYKQVVLGQHPDYLSWISLVPLQSVVAK